MERNKGSRNPMDSKEVVEVDIGNLIERLRKHVGGWELIAVMVKFDKGMKLVVKVGEEKKCA